jgi:hypothetical protein
MDRQRNAAVTRISPGFVPPPNAGSFSRTAGGFGTSRSTGSSTRGLRVSPSPEQGGSRLYRLIKGHAEPWLRIPHADETTTWPLLFNRAGDAFRIRDLVG